YTATVRIAPRKVGSCAASATEPTRAATRAAQVRFVIAPLPVSPVYGSRSSGSREEKMKRLGRGIRLRGFRSTWRVAASGGPAEAGRYARTEDSRSVGFA